MGQTVTTSTRRMVTGALATVSLIAGSLIVSAAFESAGATGTDPTWSAAQAAGGSSAAGDGNALAVTSTGQAVVAGWFSGTASFPTSSGSTSLTATGDDVFIGLWDPTSSNFSQVTQISGVGDANTHAVAMAGDDTAILTGEFDDTLTFPKAGGGSITLASRGGTAGQSAFVAAWKPSTGRFLWAQRVGGPTGADDTAYIASVAASSAGAPIITGYFSGTAHFPRGAAADDSITLVANTGGQNAFVAAMNADDSYFAWAQQMGPVGGGFGYESAYGIAMTSDDSPVITGSISGTGSGVSFPRSGVADDSIVLNASGMQDAFVAVMKSADDSYFAWAQTIGGPASGVTTGSIAVAAGSPQKPISTGSFTGTINLRKSAVADDSFALTAVSNRDDVYVAVNGSKDDSYFTQALQVSAQVGQYVQSTSISSGPDGPVLAGHFSGTITFPKAGGGTLTLTGDDSASAFVAGLNSSLSGFTWAAKAGGSVGSQALSTTVGVTTAGMPLTTGWFSGTVSFGSMSKTTASVRNIFVAAIDLSATPTPGPGPGPAPQPAYPPSAPTSVKASAGDASATVSWTAPASVGSYPITDYRVTSKPGGIMCLSVTLTCEVKGLQNGTTYTFTVEALNAAGWSVPSIESNAVVPSGAAPPADKAITIAGSRDGKRIYVTGSSTGIDPGAILKPWVRFPGQTAATEGAANIRADGKGRFAWDRKSGKKTYVYVQTADGKVTSNTVTIAP